MMTKREEEKFEQIPPNLKSIAQILLKLQLSEIPANPKVNQWYRYSPEGYVCANGDPYHGLYKIGKENKLVIYFCGGGVSLEEFTAARPNRINAPEALGFYVNDVFLLADWVSYNGLPLVCDDNPFKDWSMILVSYASGDFHTGTNDFAYHDSEMGDGILHHHGYTNYHMLIDGFKKYIDNPEKVLVTGSSGGGFATALLTDDIMDSYPNCHDVTSCVDCALLLFDGWHNTAKNQWGSPKAIYNRLVSDNIVLDSLVALHKKRPEVKIMFISSTKDVDFVRYQSWIDRREMKATEEDGVKFFRTLQQMCDDLQQKIPNIGMFLFDKLFDDIPYLTQHTILFDPSCYMVKSDGKTVLEWMYNGVNGKLEKLGMKLLK
jgi:hypothetical protein